MGPQARIAITDVDLLKEIMVKEFDNFTDRGYLVSDEMEQLYSAWNGNRLRTWTFA